MIQLLIAAFTMGMLGSFHCVGMCGPLALSLPLKSNSAIDKFTGALLYNVGRIITYAAFGILFGAVGKSLSLFGFQQWLSIIIGIVILVFIILPKRLLLFQQHNVLLRILEQIRLYLGNLFLQKNNTSLFSIGLLNGLLPCGLVYMAAAGSIATMDITRGVLFMVFFGLGTLPIMWSIAFFGNYIGVSIRIKIRKVYPYMMMLMACLLILRGLGLGIPYVSPKVEVKTQSVKGCCHKPR